FRRRNHVKKLATISTLRPRQYATVSKTHKTALQAYGGSR
nr:Chain g, 60S ribosomal protein L34-A [Saccharomyces cerevisiae BY4741]